MATQQIREEIKTYAASGFVPDTATFEALLEMARRWANTEHRRLERDAVRTRERMAAPSPASGTIDAIRVLSLQIMANAKATWADLLDETFRLPDGTVTTWGSATVRQHQIRAEALQDNAAGSVTTAARHLRAIEDIQDWFR